jgi:membrane-associated phospholipid phosphatase
MVIGIAACRVYLGVHYVSDIATGVLFGATWSLCVIAALLQGPAAS